MNTQARTLKSLTDDELAALYATAEEDALQALILAEGKRRDRLARDRRYHQERTERMHAEWYDATYAAYLTAEAATNGYMLNAEGRAAMADPIGLWSGSEARVERYVTEEMRDWFAAHGRVTFTQYVKRCEAEAVAEREAARGR